MLTFIPSGFCVKNYFKVLGLSSTADLAMIREAYRRLALSYHPDRAGDGVLQMERFREIQEAYDFLNIPGNISRHTQELNLTTVNRFASFKAWCNLNTKAWLMSWLNPKAKQALQILPLPLTIFEATFGCVKVVGNDSAKIQVYVPAACYHGQVIYECFGTSKQPTVAVAKIIPNTHFQLEERGLIMNFPISVEEARIGVRITLNTFVGPTSINLRANAQSGDEIKIAARGPRNAFAQRIDLYIRLMIVSDSKLIQQRTELCTNLRANFNQLKAA